MAAEPESAAPSSMVAAPPVWETVESVWDGWEQFCEQRPAAAASLADGEPLTVADLAVLRQLQQPATPPDSPHRFLPEVTASSACWACGATSTSREHLAWTSSPDEANPQILGIDALIAFALDASVEGRDSSPHSLWLHARYQVVRRALGVPDLLIHADLAAAEFGSPLEELLDDLIASYRRLRERWVGDGVLEAPSEWVPFLDGLQAARETRTNLLDQIRTLMADVVMQRYPALAERTTDESSLRAAGVPCSEPMWLDEV